MPKDSRRPECAVDVSSTRLLGSITDVELDHLSLGMTHNFGATITRPKELGGELLIIETEDGTRMGIAAGCTEMDAWKIAEAAFYADGVPAHVPGVRNVLPNNDSATPV